MKNLDRNRNILRAALLALPSGMLALMALLLASCSLAADITPPPGINPTTVIEEESVAETGSIFPLFTPNPQEGEKIYLEKCAPCHGTEGGGDGSLADRLPGPPPELNDPLVARQSMPSQWYRIVTEGRMDKQMPPFASLTDQQRWDVVAYLYTLSTSGERIEQGQALYQEYCSECHGESGDGNGEGAKGSTQGSVELTDLEWIANRSGTDLYQVIASGVGEVMPGYEETLSEEQRWTITEYLRSLSLIPQGSDVADIETNDGDLGQPAPGTSTELADLESGEADQLGTITGSVMNLSGGNVPDGLEILLHGFDNMQIAYTSTVPLDGSDRFLFDGIAMIPGRAYLALTEVDGVTYGSDIGLFEGGRTEIDLSIEVYESTTEISGLNIDRLHLFIEPVDDRTVRVIALYIISNQGNQVVVPVGEEEPVMSFHLPDGAYNLEFREGELGGRFVQTKDGFGDLAPIRPGSGSHQILLAYDLDLDKKLNLRQYVDIPVKAVIVLVPEDGLTIRGDSLQDAGFREMEGFSYHTYNGSGVGAGEAIEISIQRASTFSLAQLSAGSTTGLLVGISALGIALLAAGIYLYRKNQPVDEELFEEEKPVTQPEPASQEAVIDAILVLDDLYKSGQLPEEAYLKRREELKDRLRQLRGQDA